MRVEVDRVYLVREVADGLRVSVKTVYRAIDAGELVAERHGTTASGTVRVSGAAVLAYRRLCEQRAARQATPTPEDACTCGARSAAAVVAS